jgi:hypothetical protein
LEFNGHTFLSLYFADFLGLQKFWGFTVFPVPGTLKQKTCIFDLSTISTFVEAQ